MGPAGSEWGIRACLTQGLLPPTAPPLQTRGMDGAPMDEHPLIQRIAADPVLASVRLIAEAWDAGGLYQVRPYMHANSTHRSPLSLLLSGGLLPLPPHAPPGARVDDELPGGGGGGGGRGRCPRGGSPPGGVRTATRGGDRSARCDDAPRQSRWRSGCGLARGAHRGSVPTPPAVGGRHGRRERGRGGEGSPRRSTRGAIRQPNVHALRPVRRRARPWCSPAPPQALVLPPAAARRRRPRRMAEWNGGDAVQPPGHGGS